MLFFVYPADTVPQDTDDAVPGRSLTLQGVDSLAPVHDSAKGGNEMKTGAHFSSCWKIRRKQINVFPFGS